MFQFEYTLNERDFFEFNKHYAFHSPENKMYLRICRFALPIIFAFCGASIGILVDKPVISYYFYISFGVIAMIWLVFFKRIIAWQIKRNIGRIKKSGQLPYQSDVRLSFGSGGFTEATEVGETSVKYSAIKKIVVAEEAIYIYTNAVQATLIPFSVFADETHRNEFLRFMEEKRA